MPIPEGLFLKAIVFCFYMRNCGKCDGYFNKWYFWVDKWQVFLKIGILLNLLFSVFSLSNIGIAVW